VLTFFIAGLLIYLCFEHVDNLGAYSIPSGDRPSHPICLQQLTDDEGLFKLRFSMRFIVKVGDEMVGFSELEGGDPPMGTACGKFVPTGRYASIQQHCKPEALQSIPNLTIEIEGGQLIEHSGPVQIIDFGPELGEDGIQICVDGIPYPLYGELFPHHVAVYRNQFK
jgi:hypothetical protein